MKTQIFRFFDFKTILILLLNSLLYLGCGGSNTNVKYPASSSSGDRPDNSGDLPDSSRVPWDPNLPTVSIPSGQYGIGQILDITITFGEIQNVEETISMPITVGNEIKQANYHSGNETQVLVFRYTVEEGDNGISISSPISLIGGDPTSVAVNLPNNLRDIQVDGISPRLILYNRILSCRWNLSCGRTH